MSTSNQSAVTLNGGAVTGTLLAANNAGQVYTAGGLGGIAAGIQPVNASVSNWSNPPNLPSALTVTGGNVHAKGDVIVDGDLIVGGVMLTKDIGGRLDAIEERLAILRPNERLEAQWDDLRELRRQYLEREAELLEMERVIDILKNHRP